MMRKILLTGATGAIGSALVPVLMEDGDVSVTLVLRAKDSSHAKERFGKLQEFWGSQSSGWSDKIIVLAGDIAQADLGLSPSILAEITPSVTHIIHCAGNVRLNQPMDAARRDAVLSAQNMVSLAEHCASLVKIDILSTVGVAGCQPGVLPEERVDTQRKYHNTYEAAKAEAEQVYYDAIDRGLPLTIHRPSMIVGDSKTGRLIHPQVFYHICALMSGERTGGFLPRHSQHRLDIIPVDYVARAISIISKDAATKGGIFHLCSGPEHSISLSSLRVSDKKTYTVPVWVFGSLLPKLAFLFPSGVGRVLKSLPFLTAYLGARQSFDNKNSQTYLEKKNCLRPKPDDYLSTILQQKKK